MPELKEFVNVDFAMLEAKKAQIDECVKNHVKEGGPACQKCPRKDTEECVKVCACCPLVADCDKIKSYTLLQFQVGSERLRQCQASNGRASCLDCELFFECGVRHDYVRATYEKMNEGRGGEFAF